MYILFFLSYPSKSCIDPIKAGFLTLRFLNNIRIRLLFFISIIQILFIFIKPTGYGYLPPPPPVVVPVKYCNKECFGLCCGLGISYIIIIGLLALFAIFLSKLLGLVALAITPAIFLLVFLERQYRKSVIRMQMVITFCEAALWMIPIVLLENVAFALIMKYGDLPEEGACPRCVLSAFIQVRKGL